MKLNLQTSYMKRIGMLFTLALVNMMAFAQDSTGGTMTTTTATSTTTEHTWYTQPWAWIVGGAIFIIIIIALVRGNSSNTSTSDRTTVTKTVSRDSDVV
jgi:hypothetical protein